MFYKGQNFQLKMHNSHKYFNANKNTLHEQHKSPTANKLNISHTANKTQFSTAKKNIFLWKKKGLQTKLVLALQTK